MKKFKYLLLTGLSVALLAGCSNPVTTDTTKAVDTKAESMADASDGQTQSVDNTTDKPTVTVTTSFLYDMVNQVAGDLVEKEIIVPAGEDPHLYVAKPEDLRKIAEADLVLYHGLHFEGKMQEILDAKGFAVSSTFDESRLDTMEEDGEEIIDPHFWFDIDLYKEASSNAANELIKLLPESREQISSNLEDYLVRLTALDEANQAALESIPKENRYLITPHDAFQYFAKSYNIEVVAPQGISTDSEVANKDLEDTVNFIVEHQVKAIFAESTTDPARMEKLKEACSAKGFEVQVISGEGNELFSDSLAPIGETGDTFIDMYEHNIKLITEHLK